MFNKFNKPQIVCKGEDFFHGHIGTTNFQFSDISFVEKSEMPLDDQQINITLFQGVVFVEDFHKSFTGTTMITTTKGKAYIHLNVVGSRIQTISHDFDRLFKLYTTDEIRYDALLNLNLKIWSKQEGKSSALLK